MDCVLAMDLGGSLLKAALVAVDGSFLAQEARVEAPLVTDARGLSEKNPREWWEGLGHLVAALLARPEAAGIAVRGLAACGVTRTQVFLDGQGAVIRPAFSFADGRAGDQAARIAARQAELGTRGVTFGPMNSFHTLARLLWLKEKEPRSFDRLALVLEPKDYLNYRLTGQAGGDLVSLSRLLTVAGRDFCRELFDRLGLPAEVVPPLRHPWELLGRVRRGLKAPWDRLAGVPVLVGGMDAWCGCLGVGAVRPGAAYNVSGTSEVFGLVAGAYRGAPGLVSLPWGPGLFQIGGPSQAGADCLAWCLEALGEGERPDWGTALADLARAPRQPAPILFLPYLRGERTPLWRPDARGLFLGLDRKHGRTDFLWAVLEGVALANRQVRDLATGGMAGACREVRITGGAARQDLWCQVKADVLGLPVVRTACPEGGLLGAAMTAWVGLKEYADLAQAQDRLVRVERTFLPRPAKVAAYDRLYGHWCNAQAAMLPVSEALTREVGVGLTLGAGTSIGTQGEESR